MARKIDWEEKKINTVKKFREYLIDMLDNDRFIIYDCNDPDFDYPENQISFHGKDEDEVFTFEIVKVK